MHSALRPLSPDDWEPMFRGDGDAVVSGLVAPWFAAYTIVRNPDSTGTVHPEVAAHIVAAARDCGLLPPTRFAVWRGYAEFNWLPADGVTLAPDRDMVIFEGRPEYAVRPWTEFGSARIPMRWWPADLGWMLAGDLYSRAVVVAGPAALADRLLADPMLDAVALEPKSTLRAHEL